MEARQLNTTTRLLLTTTDGELCLSLNGDRAIFLGRDDSCDLVLHGEQVSRVHARIQPESQYFFLYDFSTNGCFFKGEDEQITFIRRQKVRLWGEGLISLGSPDFTEAVV